MKYKILVIDDEPDVVHLIKDYLELNEYDVLIAYNSNEALEKLNNRPDLILLDINMPGMNGLELCKKIRDFVSCPILFVTANATESDRITGLLVGGDDYIVKPFGLKELNARIHAHLRRENRRMIVDEFKFFNHFRICLSMHKLFYDKTEVVLTKTEFDIMSFLLVNRNQVLSKDQIYEHLWGYDKFGDSSIITEHIRRIRGKLKQFEASEVIETIWGVGYRIQEN